MNSKLMMLERQLSRASSGTPTEDATSKFMTSYKMEVDRQSETAINAADDKRVKAEAEVSNLTTQLAELSKELMQIRKDSQYKVTDVEEAAEQKMEAVCGRHAGEMQQMQSQIDALRGQLSTERQDKIRAQTQKEAADSMCAHLQQTIEKLQAVKPVVVAPAVERKPTPMTAKVTQRDENGRIVSMSITSTL